MRRCGFSVARALERFPIVILLFVGSVCLVLTLVAFLCADLPDFSDPIKGFATRRTEISDRWLAWRLLQENSRHQRDFYRFPTDIEKQFQNHRVQKRTLQEINTTHLPTTVSSGSTLATRKYPRQRRQENRKKNARNEFALKRKWKDRMPRFCAQEPDERYVQLVFEVGHYESESTIVALCRAQQKLWEMNLLSRTDECVRAASNLSKSKKAPKRCCSPWHLGSVAADILGHQNCDKINHTELEWSGKVWPELLKCATQKDAVMKSWERPSMKLKKTPYPDCKNQRIYLMLKYLLPESFPNFDSSKNITMMILPLTQSHSLIESGVFTPKSVEKMTSELREIPGAWLAGLDLGFDVRTVFFLEYLLTDSAFGILSVFLVLACVWLYTGSFLFTLAAVSGICMSAGFAYFIYRMVFGIDFFPFMNLLTFVLLIGVGADDTFIFRRAWLQAKSDKNCGTLVKIIHDTLSHACLSMLVTSLTTAAAFYANLVSDIIVIKCFGIFAGTTILTNYFFVVTWLPAAVILLEKYDSEYSCGSTDWIKKFSNGKLKHLLTFLLQPLHELYQFCSDKGRIWFEVVLPYLVIRLRYIWILLLGAFSIIAGISVFHYPGLRLPAKDHFQFFKWSHPFEKFESDFKGQFLFRRSTRAQDPLLIRIVWGIEPVGDSNILNPDQIGHLERRKIDFTDNLSILWLRDFCTDLAKQSFTRYQAGSGPMLHNCFIVDFMNHMQTQTCHDKILNKSHVPCCRDNPFPYRPGTFKTCLKRLIQGFESEILLTDLMTARFGPVGPLFVEGRSGAAELGAVVVAFPSKYNFSLGFWPMDEFFRTVDSWVKEKLSAGPKSVRGGFLASEQLHMYDLQKALLYGTKLSVCVAVAIAYVVLVASTRNVLISLLAIITISGVIFATVALLIFMDWELNVLESTIIILTIGLSFDFTLHYAVAYKLCTEYSRESRVIYAMMRVGSPIFMSFITTMAAGSAMLFATTLAYFQIGLFMILQAAISWIYSTFFFASLLRVFGPAGNCCEVTCFESSRRHSAGGRKTPESSRSHRPSTTLGGRSTAMNVSECGELEPMVQIAIRRNSSNQNRFSFKTRAANSIRRASIPVVRKVSSVPKTCCTAPNSARASEIIRDPESQDLTFIDSHADDEEKTDATDVTSSMVIENRYSEPAHTGSFTPESSDAVWSANVSGENSPRKIFPKVFTVPNCENFTLTDDQTAPQYLHPKTAVQTTKV